MQNKHSRRTVAVRFAIVTLGLGLGTAYAQQEVKLGALYQCPGDARMRVYSCTGTNPTDGCEAELRLPGQQAQRGPLTRQQLMSLLAACRPLDPAAGNGAAGSGNAGAGGTAGAGNAGAGANGAAGAGNTAGANTTAGPGKAAAGANAPDGGNSAGVAANEPDRNGFKIGDEVRAATAGGWYQAKIVQRNGDSYRVRFNASTEALKTYPTELRRVGPLNDMDRARGLFDLKEQVQVNVEGKWVNGVVIGEMGMDYNVEIPGNRSVWANAQQMRRVAAAPEPAAAKGGTPPKAGLKQCADKFNGRYSPAGGVGGPGFQLTLRSGKASLQEISGTTELECWSDGQRLYLHKVGETADQDMPVEINDDGTLDTPFGEVKRKGK